MKKINTLLILATVSINAIATSNAVAQSNAVSSESETAGSAEIIVTAQRRTERLQDVPVSVGVIAGEALTRQNLSNLEGISNRTAGVVIRAASGGDQIAIRGTSSGFNPGFEQSVATFVDGVYRPRARSSAVALFDIERLEVLKGPQTTFFGANAIAGALNIVTRKPKRDFGANVLGFFSPDDDEFRLEAGIDMPVGENFAIRVAGRTNQMDAITENTRINRRGKLGTDQVRISAIGDLSDRISFEARFDYARIRNTGAFAFEITNCPPVGVPPAGQCARSLTVPGLIDNRVDRRTQQATLDRFALDLYEGALSATFDLGFADLVTTTSYQEQRARLTQDATGWPLPSPLGVDSLIVPDTAEEFNQFSQEIRLQSSSDGPLSYMVGGYFERGDTTVPFTIGFFQAPFGSFAPAFFNATDLIAASSLGKQKSTTWSGFGSLSYEPIPELKVSVGLRYSNVTKDADRSGFIGTVANYGNPQLAPYLIGMVTPGPIDGQRILAPILGWSLAQYPVRSRTDDEWMPSANISYDITPDIMTYISYTHGFKAGGYNLFAGTDTFGPEKADAYEFGVKAAWFNRRLTTNFTLFQTDYGNLQESGNLFLTSGAFIPFIGNVAKSRAKGAELEVNAAVMEGFNLNASLAYLDSKYLDYPNAPCSPLQNALAAMPGSTTVCPRPNLKGSTRSNAPKWSGSVSADYAREISSNLKAGLGGTVYFRSKYFLQSIPEDIISQGGFAKVDIRATLSNVDNIWEISLIGQNIFNKDTVSFGAHAGAGAGSTKFTADRARSIGVQFKINFGSSR